MKSSIILVVVLFFLIALSSCQKEDANETVTQEGRQVSESSDENFKIILYSEKDVYTETDEVNIWATIEYIGSQDSIDIYSGEPYAGFTVESEGVTFISTYIYQLLKTTTLEKGIIYQFPMKKVGAYSEDDEDADFWRAFYQEEKMLFPIGEYQLIFSTEFSTDYSSDFQLTVQYQFEVE